MSETWPPTTKVMHPLTAVARYGYNRFRQLRAEHYERSFPTRTPEEIANFLGNTTLRSFIFPHSQVGKWRKAKQGYSRPRIAMYIENNKPVAYAKFASNASTSIGKRNPDFAPSHTPKQRLSQFIKDLAGKVEIHAKLRLPRLPQFLGTIATRYNEQQAKFARSNYLTLEEVVTDDAHTHEAPRVVLDGMRQVLRNPRRRVTIYPYKEERGFQNEQLEDDVQDWGMWATSHEILPKSPFGTDSESPEQIRFEGAGEEVITALAAIANTQ